MNWLVQNWAVIGTVALGLAGAYVAYTKTTKNTADDARAAKVMAVIKRVFGK
ncbi:hypothetical protein KKH36_04255 [Patescibacteria group bacterium]|nr:hypothetical protein [Patescibacteria group bacterium]